MRILGVLYVGVLVVHVRYTYCWYCSNSDSAERSRRFSLHATDYSCARCVVSFSDMFSEP